MTKKEEKQKDPVQPSPNARYRLKQISAPNTAQSQTKGGDNYALSRGLILSCSSQFLYSALFKGQFQV
jgi:hypothetical protein